MGTVTAARFFPHIGYFEPQPRKPLVAARLALTTTAFNDPHNPADDGVVGVGTGAQSSGAITGG
jgi:hypothetical protein